MADEADRALGALLRTRARPEGLTWLDDQIARIATGAADVAVALPGAGRQVGRGGLDAPGATLQATGGDVVSLAAWRLDDAARARLLLADARREPTGAVARAWTRYQEGDARERTGVLRALAFLPGADTDPAALPAILDAMRVTQGEIFEAAICDNPYASRHLPQHEFRKAVLKAIFIGLSIRRVVRLEERVDAELAQSLIDLATEREAATRGVPAELWPVAARFPPPGLAGKLVGYLEHPSVEHREAAAIALGRIAPADPRVIPFLADRLARERDPAVAEALRRAIG